MSRWKVADEINAAMSCEWKYKQNIHKLRRHIECQKFQIPRSGFFTRESSLHFTPAKRKKKTWRRD